MALLALASMLVSVLVLVSALVLISALVLVSVLVLVFVLRSVCGLAVVCSHRRFPPIPLGLVWTPGLTESVVHDPHAPVVMRHLGPSWLPPWRQE